MSDLSKTIHNLEDLLAGKIDFAGFRDGELALVKANVASLAPALQPAVTIAVDSLAAGASTLVAAGETALGPIINASSDTQATLLLNAMQAAGIPTAGPLSIAEHAALVTLINGFKAYLDRMHIHFAAPAPAAEPAAA